MLRFLNRCWEKAYYKHRPSLTDEDAFVVVGSFPRVSGAFLTVTLGISFLTVKSGISSSFFTVTDGISSLFLAGRGTSFFFLLATAEEASSSGEIPRTIAFFAAAPCQSNKHTGTHQTYIMTMLHGAAHETNTRTKKRSYGRTSQGGAHGTQNNSDGNATTLTFPLAAAPLESYALAGSDSIN